MLKNNDWIILNSITYKIHSVENMDEMRQVLIHQLGFLIDFDSASFYLASAENANELECPVGVNYSEKDMNEYITHFKDMDYSEGLMFTGKNIAYRESDIVPEELRRNSEYYKAVYDVQGWHYSLHLNICYQEKFLGVLSFFRKKGAEDFVYDDIFVLDMIKDHLAYRLQEEQNRMKDKKHSVEECVEKYLLSGKEAQVLQELIHDASAEEIADRLDISVSTLRKHCNHIYKKMGISQRIQLYDMVG